MPVLPDTDNPLAELLGVFNLPVDPLAVLGLGRDVDDERPRPLNLRREDLGLDVFGALCIVRAGEKDSAVAKLAPVFCRQVLHLLKPRLTLVDVAHENILHLIRHVNLGGIGLPTTVVL